MSRFAGKGHNSRRGISRGGRLPLVPDCPLALLQADFLSQYQAVLKDWMPLFIGALTAGVTLTGVLVTQWRSDRRDSARLRDEARREALRLTHEDNARVFEHRREAYVEFLSGARFNLTALRDWWDREPDHDPPDDALSGLGARLATVKIYGSPEAARIADALYEWHRVEMFGSKDERNDSHRGGYQRLSDAFVGQIRYDLSVDSADGAR
jgi:hypothetical protein